MEACGNHPLYFSYIVSDVSFKTICLIERYVTCYLALATFLQFKLGISSTRSACDSPQRMDQEVYRSKGCLQSDSEIQSLAPKTYHDLCHDALDLLAINEELHPETKRNKQASTRHCGFAKLKLKNAIENRRGQSCQSQTAAQHSGGTCLARCIPYYANTLHTLIVLANALPPLSATQVA